MADPLTTDEAAKAVLEDLDSDLEPEVENPLGDPIRFWRWDEAPDDAAYPFVAHLGLTEVPTLVGDAATVGWREAFQISVFESGPVADAVDGKDLHQRVADLLDGARHGGFRFSVQSITDVPPDVDEGSEVVRHHAITVRRARLK